MNLERRHSIRTRLYRISYVQIEPDNGAIVVDLSGDGLSFQAAAPVHHRAQVHFWFSSPVRGRLAACGEVEWIDETKKRGGLRFLHLAEDTRQYVRELLVRPECPAEPQLDSTPTLAFTKAMKKLTPIRADRPSSLGQSVPSILPAPINARELAMSSQYDEPAPSPLNNLKQAAHWVWKEPIPRCNAGAEPI